MESSLARVPRVAAGVEIGPDAGSSENVTVAAPIERYFDVSPEAARLLRQIDGRLTIEDLASRLSRDGAPLPARALADLIDRTLAPAGLVHFGTEPRPIEGPGSPMWWSATLIPAPLVNVLAAPLTVLFPSPVAVALVLVSLAAHAWFVASGGAATIPSDWNALLKWRWPALAWAASLLLHELGHAAALRSRGERPGGIGIGSYAIWPVMFADVTRAWKLPRRARAVVDVGGLFVQLLVATALIGAWHFAPRAGFARAALLIDLGMIANLNPLLRWDGYWLLVDLTGATNLRRRSHAHAGARARGRADSVPALIGAYAWLSVAYFIAFALWLMLGIAPRIARVAAGAWRQWRAAPASSPLTSVAFAIAAALAATALVAVIIRGARTGIEMLRARGR